MRRFCSMCGIIIGAMPRRPAGIPGSEPLFGAETAADAPLAARMRPRTLDDFVGQGHLIGPEGALTRVVKPGFPAQPRPLGTAGQRQDHAGAPPRGSCRRDVASAVGGDERRRRHPRWWRRRSSAGGRRADGRLHRRAASASTRAQQDALVPHVEEGTMTSIGATTENPYYEINSPLLSRMRVYRLGAATPRRWHDRRSRAGHPDRGLAGRVALADEARTALLDLAGGDARAGARTSSMPPPPSRRTATR